MSGVPASERKPSDLKVFKTYFELNNKIQKEILPYLLNENHTININGVVYKKGDRYYDKKTDELFNKFEDTIREIGKELFESNSFYPTNRRDKSANTWLLKKRLEHQDNTLGLIFFLNSLFSEYIELFKDFKFYQNIAKIIDEFITDVKRFKEYNHKMFSCINENVTN